MARETTTKITFLVSILICSIVTILFCGNYGSDSNNNIINAAFAASVGEDIQNQLPSQQPQQPNIKASNIYQTQTVVPGKNIKNLVILIPNEGHEDPTVPKDLRVINQPYIPQNAVVNVGTTVTWLNADAGHRHSITLVDNATKNIITIVVDLTTLMLQSHLHLIVQVLLLILDQAMIEQFQIIK